MANGIKLGTPIDVLPDAISATRSESQLDGLASYHITVVKGMILAALDAG